MSRKQAIDDMCKSCIYDPWAKGCGSWRQQVEDCKSDGIDGRSKCPLFDYRPKTKATTTEQANKEHHMRKDK